MTFSKFLNNINKFQAFFNLISKNSFIIRQFHTYLFTFKSSSRCRCNTIFLCLFVYLRQLLQFVEINFANICINAIFEQINVYRKLRRGKKLEIRLIKVFVLSQRISFVDINCFNYFKSFKLFKKLLNHHIS